MFTEKWAGLCLSFFCARVNPKMPYEDPFAVGDLTCSCGVSFLLREWPFLGENYVLGKLAGKSVKSVRNLSEFAGVFL